MRRLAGPWILPFITVVLFAGCGSDAVTTDGGRQPDAGAADAGDARPDGTADQGKDTGGPPPPDMSGDQNQGGDTGPPPSAAGFVVTVALSPDPARPAPLPTPVPGLPGTETFTLYVDTGSQPRLVASRAGAVNVARLVQQQNGRWKTSESFRVGPTAGYEGVCQGFGAFTYASAEFSFTASGLSGTVSGGAEYITGDVVQMVPFTGTLTGVPDRISPGVSFLPPTTPHPMDQVRVLFSEALPPGTTASLAGPGSLRVALEGDPTPGAYQARFSVRGSLRQDTTYRVVVEPPLVDLAGNIAPAMAFVMTTRAVPLIPEDGFEGGTGPLLAGGAEIAAAGVAPPIAGSRSLLFRPRAGGQGAAARFTARLAVASGDRFVRATYRPIVGERTWLQYQTSLVLRTPAGATATKMLPAAAEPLTCTGGGQTPPCYGAPVALEIALPAGTVDEVMIDANRVLQCGLPPPPEPGFLLDDLRVE